MELSICIVSYQCAEKLRRCLESIRAHRPTVAHEVIVVDNGSQDGTVEMLREVFYWVRLISNPDNRGFSRAMNQAVAAATGEALLMLNPDTEMLHGALDGLFRFVRERPWIGAVGPKLVSPEGDPEMSCREFPTLMNAFWGLTGLSRAFSGSRVFGHFEMTWWDHSEPRGVDWLSGAALMCTRAAWGKVGPLDEAFFLQGAELDWQKRLSRLGLERWYLPTVSVVHYPGRSWGGSEAEEVVRLYRAAFQYFRKHHSILSSPILRTMALLVSLTKALWHTARSLAPAHREEASLRARRQWALCAAALGAGARTPRLTP